MSTVIIFSSARALLISKTSLIFFISCSWVRAEIILEFLNIFDDLKRAVRSIDRPDSKIEKIKNGLELILDNFNKVLEKEGVKQIDCIGEHFNPNFHECVMTEESETLPNNLIIEELREGYCLNDRIIRPSRVKITKK